MFRSSSLRAAALAVVLTVLMAPPVEGQPQIRITNVDLAEGNTGFTQAILKVTLTAPSDGVVTVDLTSSPGAPAATAGAACGSDVDYLQPAGRVRFDPGVVSQNVSVAICGEIVNEADEIFRVDLINPVGATLADLRGRVTILNDDALPEPRMSDAAASEGGLLNFTVFLTAPAPETVTIALDVAAGTTSGGGTACDGTRDFLSSTVPATLVYAAGESSKTFSIQSCEDTLTEGDETFQVTARRSAPNPSTSFDPGTGTIRDVPLPEPRMSDAAATEGGLLNFAVFLTAPSEETVTIGLGVVAGTTSGGGPACDGTHDFLSSTVPPTLVYAPGESSKTFSIQSCVDTLFEGDETFQVVARRTAPAPSTSSDPGTGTIRDDLPVLSIGDATGGESRPIDLTLTLSKPTPLHMPITYTARVSPRFAATQGSFCGPGVDFFTSGTAAITAGNTRGIVRVTPCDDKVRELSERVTIVLTQPAGAALGDAEGAVTIVDDD